MSSAEFNLAGLDHASLESGAKFLENLAVLRREAGPDFDVCVRLTQSLFQLAGRSISAGYASSRSSNSAGSGLSRLSGVSGTGNAISRLDDINRLQEWRTNCAGNSQLPSDNSAVRPSPSVAAQPFGFRGRKVPAGFCYSKLLRPAARESVLMRVSDWPTFGSLVRLSAKNFKSLDELRSFRLVKNDLGLHVAPGGDKGCSFLDAVACYSSRVKVLDGSIGAKVKQEWVKQGEVPGWVNGQARVGGEPYVLDPCWANGQFSVDNQRCVLNSRDVIVGAKLAGDLVLKGSLGSGPLEFFTVVVGAEEAVTFKVRRAGFFYVPSGMHCNVDSLEDSAKVCRRVDFSEGQYVSLHFPRQSGVVHVPGCYGDATLL